QPSFVRECPGRRRGPARAPAAAGGADAERGAAARRGRAAVRGQGLRQAVFERPVQRGHRQLCVFPRLGRGPVPTLRRAIQVQSAHTHTHTLSHTHIHARARNKAHIHQAGVCVLCRAVQ
ncbi:unnamed protein product, partial [Tetraodon nigroviridis]